ncbi:MAG TPA: hypothetical protein VFV78_12195 [Vicinamibacterales bacterium]|nr:hypothetical protein [Vicinamibacterales bacterium]
MRRLSGGVALVLTLALGSAGCDNNIDLPTTPNTPVDTVTESFAGSITPNGAVSYFFASTAAGGMTATILTLTPDSSVILGLSIGTWNGFSCQSVISNERATQGTTVSGNVSGAGTLCVRIFDSGGAMPASSKFEIVVVHP